MKNFLIFLLALLTQASLSARRESPEKIQIPDRKTPEPQTPRPMFPQTPKHNPLKIVCFAGQK
jgi:hypothetical protein